ncbi:hypothetical protein EJP77_00055 [Paenibacillus zeisoli]|uniref:Peptidase n=1 Tax=Paenibacillus zeisoli TaxID=2496267 RepID=A0A3S1BVV5_9BACL|nr:DUF1796 family putative cysteine peptidase [Paenibacillus zeisoli]RUT35464.1 hypothetical protein EJP77_00055 [Paenibacillus zeisoli]
MIESSLKGTYNAVFSLGANCQTAYQLRRLGLRSYAGPFDWFISSYHSGLIAVLENRFEDFMKLDQLKLVGQFKTCYCIKDEKYGIYSYHDFPVELPEERWADAYPEFHERQIRRQERFLQAATTMDRILFVRLNSSSEEALQLQHTLSDLTRRPFTLLIVNTREDAAPEICPESRHGIITAVLNKGSDWRGDNKGWEQLLQHITLQN